MERHCGNSEEGEGLLYSTEAEAEVILVSQFYGP